MSPLVVGSAAAVLAFAATPLVRRMAVRAGVLDRPGGRKWQEAPVPRLGGLAVFAGLAPALLFASLAKGAPTPTEAAILVVLLAGMAGAGLLDDLRNLAAGRKLALQGILALAAIAAGYRVRGVVLPWLGAIDLGPLAVPVTLLWLVGVTNALNLVDGMDGLAPGVATISAAASAAIAAHAGAYDTALLFAAVAGASLGFLPHNRRPARVYLGDCGSLLLGFALALVSVRGATKAAVAVSLVAPALALGFPIADAAFALVRRARGGLIAGISAVARPDADHIHHRLARLGLTRGETVGLLHAGCAVLGLAAFASTLRGDATAVGIVAYAALVSVLGVRMVGRAGREAPGGGKRGRRGERSVLVVHPDGEISAAVRREAEALGLAAFETPSLEDGARLARDRSFDLVVAPAEGGGGVPLASLRGACPNAVLLAFAGLADADAGLEHLRRGAYDLLEVPPVPARTRLVLARALERASLTSRFRIAASLFWMVVLAAPLLAYVAASVR